MAREKEREKGRKEYRLARSTRSGWKRERELGSSNSVTSSLLYQGEWGGRKEEADSTKEISLGIPVAKSAREKTGFYG